METRKRIWILNHHATEMAKQHGGRHYYFAKYLIEKNYKVNIFCASVYHRKQEKVIELEGEKSKEQIVDGIPFIFVKTRNYKGNGIQRILSMFDYYFNVKKISNKYSKPDIIIGSSVHPLACVAAINLSKKYSCKNIIELRDLWPEAIFAHYKKSNRNLLYIVLSFFEKILYIQADKLVFTMEGGYDYIRDKGWDKFIPQKKVFYINNGVDLNSFNFNKKKYKINDSDLLNDDLVKIVYTGSISKVNNLGLIVKVAELVEKREPNILFIIYGNGSELNSLRELVKIKNLNNIKFKGFIEKKYIPYIVSNADFNLLHCQTSVLEKYGASQNKMFDYFAAGKPIISTINVGYDLVQQYKAGVSMNTQNPIEIKNMILKMVSNSFEEKLSYSMGARNVSFIFDYRQLTDKLRTLIEE